MKAHHIIRIFFIVSCMDSTLSLDCDDRKHIYVCDDSPSITLECPTRATIEVVYANYGRTEFDPIRCPSSSAHANDVTCSNLANTKPVVEGLCNGRSACALDITQDAYITPDPCPGTNKYLDVEYDCVDPSGQCAVFCGEDVIIGMDESYEFSSPHHPSIYPNYADCVWNVSVIQLDAIIKLEIQILFIESQCADYLYVFDAIGGADVRICLEHLYNLGPVLTASNHLNMLFYSDSNIAFTGFSATATPIQVPVCSPTPLALSQLSKEAILSPFYPSPYPLLYSCEWHFTTQPLWFVIIKFHDLNLEEECQNDYVLIKDTTTSEHRYCGRSTPEETLVFETTELSLYFHTNYLVTGRGFNLTVTTSIDFDECEYDADHICDNDINQLAECTNSIEGYSCVCPYGENGVFWDGENCTTGESPDNLCQVQNGLCEQICVPYSMVGSDPVSPVVNYTCDCGDGFILAGDERSCIDINECESNTTCQSSAQPVPYCINTIGSFECICTIGLLWNSTAGQCKDVNECLDDNGLCEQICTNSLGSFSCVCDEGFELLQNRRSCQDINECQTDNGGCEQICHNDLGSSSCSCYPGYSLHLDNTSCTDLFECDEGNGGCGQLCVDIEGGFVCDCGAGYSLAVDERTCTDVDECTGSQQPHGCQQICVNLQGGFQCECLTGFSLDEDNQTCSDIDECLTDQSGCAHLCNNIIGSYQCSCRDGYFLLPDTKNCADDNECIDLSHTCDFQCVNMQGSFQCICDQGYRLNNDEESCSDINECSTFNGFCQDMCHDIDGGYNCSCSEGYSLRVDGRTCSDINECMAGHQCQHECINVPGSSYCICKEGFSLNGDSETCDDINECSVYNGRCAHVCHNLDGGHNCSCHEGYTINIDGLTCLDINECDTDQHGCQQLCVNEPGTYRCVCQQGYTLDEDTVGCSDINECADDVSGCAFNCTNTNGSFICSCDEGYALLPDTLNCGDLNECTTNTHSCNQICENNYGSYKCLCEEGYELDDEVTCKDMNECDFSNGFCQQLCNNSAGGHQCSCRDGYSLNPDDRTCTDVDECLDSLHNPCTQDCWNNIGSFFCTCDEGFNLHENGVTCVDVNECDLDTDGCSQNCSNTIGSFECSCDHGYVLQPDSKSCVDRNECVSPDGNICEQTCVNDMGGYQCACLTGFVLGEDLFSCDDINECDIDDSSDCEQICNNTIGSYSCSCGNGYSLLRDKKSCQDIDECTAVSGNPCSYACINDLGSFHCTCPMEDILHPDGYQCMGGGFYYTIELHLDAEYTDDMADARSTSFISLSDALMTSVLLLSDNSLDLRPTQVFLMYLRQGSVIAELNVHFDQELNHTQISIVSYELSVALSRLGDHLTVAGESVRMLGGLTYVYRGSNLEKKWEVSSVCHLYDNTGLCSDNSRCAEVDGKPKCKCHENYMKEEGGCVAVLNCGENAHYLEGQCVAMDSGLSTPVIIVIATVCGMFVVITCLLLCLCICRKYRMKQPKDYSEDTSQSMVGIVDHPVRTIGEFALARSQPLMESPHIGNHQRGSPHMENHQRGSPHMENHQRGSPHMGNHQRGSPHMGNHHRGSPHMGNHHFTESPHMTSRRRNSYSGLRWQYWY